MKFEAFVSSRSAKNCPDLEMSLQSIPAIFATDAGLLEPAEGRERRMRRAVDHHATAFQLLGDAMRVPEIGALDIGLQAVGLSLAIAIASSSSS